MTRAILIVFALLSTGSAFAQSNALAVTSGASEETSPMSPTDITDTNLDDFIWEKRPIVVFADSDQDPRFREQLELLEARIEFLEDRDVVILTDTDPAGASELRRKLRPRGFMMVLIGKDGGVKLRKPFPWSVRELSRTIDKMPLRREELRNARQNNG
ncbi:MAG: DUF4174 domain-containing protein [Litoreibacter sp.]